MKNLLLILSGFAFCGAASASSDVTFPVNCANNVSITAASTLQDVQKCTIDKQKTSKGMYEVKFTDANKHKYTCYFANNTPTEVINHCES